MKIEQKKAALAALTISTMFMLLILANVMVTATQGNKDIAWATHIKQSPYEGIEIKTRIADEKRYRLAVHYPVFLKQELNEEIETYITEKEMSFIEKAKTEKGIWKNHPDSFSISFQLVQAGDELYSILFETETYTSSGEHQTSYDTMMADTAAGLFLNGHDLFIDPRKAASAFERLAEEEGLPVPARFEGNERDFFYIGENEVVFLAENNKKENVHLPLRKVSPYLKKEWRDRLAVNNAPLKTAVKKPPKTDKLQGGKSKKAALTFDDGPNPESTGAILTILKKYKAKATFFVLGSRVEFYPELVEQIVQEGHQVGNHTWSHKDLTKLPPGEITKEIDLTAAAVEAAAGVSPVAVRPPYGATNKQVNDLLGIEPVLWTIDTMDWKSHDPKAISGIVKKEAKDGAIILMHDIHHTTVLALEELIVSLQKEGYELVTVDDL